MKLNADGALQNVTRLTQEQLDQYESNGFAVLPGFAGPEVTGDMLLCARDVARRKESGGAIHDALVQPEAALEATLPLAERTSKIFRVHRHEPVFNGFATRPDVAAAVGSLLGPDIDCFLSQFIFKQPGALGQPWHQDAFYFPFTGPPQVGVWLAVTEARLDNGPLWVVPGSHREHVHPAIKDTRPHANHGYVEIVDHNMSQAQPVLLQPGDVLLFHSHLMHKSTDNGADDLRAAMVYHYATADTVDNSVAVYGRKPANQDWLPVLRNGAGV